MHAITETSGAGQVQIDTDRFKEINAFRLSVYLFTEPDILPKIWFVLVIQQMKWFHKL